MKNQVALLEMNKLYTSHQRRNHGVLAASACSRSHATTRRPQRRPSLHRAQETVLIGHRRVRQDVSPRRRGCICLAITKGGVKEDVDRINGFLRSINEELDLESKATLVELPVFFGTDAPEQFFDFARWRQHKSQSRYGRLLLGILFGITTRRILLIVVMLTLFSQLVGLYNSAASSNSDLPELALPLTPFELTAPVLGLLLVFRTNSAYERFSSGNTCSWEVTGQVRNSLPNALQRITLSSTKLYISRCACALVSSGFLNGLCMCGACASFDACSESCPAADGPSSRCATSFATSWSTPRPRRRRRPSRRQPGT